MVEALCCGEGRLVRVKGMMDGANWKKTPGSGCRGPETMTEVQLSCIKKPESRINKKNRATTEQLRSKN